MKKVLFLVILLLSASPLRGQTRFEFNADTKLGYLNLYQQPFLPQHVLGLEFMVATGIKGAYFLENSQFSYGLTPGVYVVTNNKPDGGAKASFYFHEVFLRMDIGSVSAVLGKRQLAWGVGSIRQYSFITNTSHAEETARYYNAEFLFRHQGLLFSVGGIMDTSSVNIWETPKWGGAWVYLRYDQPKYMILTAWNIYYAAGLYDFKGSLEFQYFLPKDFQIYGTLAYFFVKDNGSGLKKNIRFLAGLSWQLLYENKIMFTPAIEYAYELDYNIISGGFILEIKKLALSFFVNYEINTEISRPGILARFQWSLPHSVTLYITWQSFFWDKDNMIKHSLTARVLWNM